MSSDLMEEVRVVIFDVYHTLLAVDPGPADAAGQWVNLWEDFFGVAPVLSFSEFDEACRDAVAEDHALGKANGVKWPEVDWRQVSAKAASELSGLAGAKLDAFLFAHAKLQRHTRAMPGATAFLTKVRQQGILTGIASNAQGYTFDELDEAEIPVASFKADLCFWSFQRGFSKPDPAVFACLGERLAARGILRHQTLMIGDRLDNDIEPARAAGWQTWHFRGSWPEL